MRLLVWVPPLAQQRARATALLLAPLLALLLVQAAVLDQVLLVPGLCWRDGA